MNNPNETNRNLNRNLTKETTDMYSFETEDNNTDFNMHINSQSIQQYHNNGQPSWHSYSIDGMTLSETYPSEAHAASHQQFRNSSTFTTQGLNYNSLSGSHLSKIPRQIVPSERIDTFSGLTSLSVTDNNAPQSQTTAQNTSSHSQYSMVPFIIDTDSLLEEQNQKDSQEEQIEEIASTIDIDHINNNNIITTASSSRVAKSPLTSTELTSNNNNHNITTSITRRSNQSSSSSATTPSLSHVLIQQQQQSMTTNSPSNNNSAATSTTTPISNNHHTILMQHHHPFFNPSSSNNLVLLEGPLINSNNNLMVIDKSSSIAFEQDGKNHSTATSITTNNNNNIQSFQSQHQQLLMNAQSSNSSMNGCYPPHGNNTNSNSGNISSLISMNNTTNNNNNNMNMNNATSNAANTTIGNNCLGNNMNNNNNQQQQHYNPHNNNSLTSTMQQNQFHTSFQNGMEDSSSLDNSLNSFINSNTQTINTHQHCLDEALEGIDFQIMDLANEGFPNQFLTSSNNGSVNDHVDMDSSNSIQHQHAIISSHMPSHELIDHMLLNHNSITNTAATNNTLDQKQNSIKKEAKTNDQDNSKNTYTPITFTVDQLRPHFETPIKNVAAMLNISLTQLKRVCRTVGIPRWPYRKIQSLKSKINEKNILLEKLLKQSKVIIDPLKRQNVENRIMTMKNDIANVEKQIQQIKLDPKCAISGNFDNNSDTMQESEGSENNSITFHNHQVITNTHVKSGAIMGQMRSVVHNGKTPRRGSTVKGASNAPTVVPHNNGTPIIINQPQQQQDNSNGKRKMRSVEHVALNNNTNLYPQQQQHQMDMKSIQQPNMFNNNQYGNTMQNNSNMNYNFMQQQAIEIDRKKRKMNDLSPPPQNMQMSNNNTYPNNTFVNSPVNNQSFTFNNTPQQNNQPTQFYFNGNNNYVPNNNGGDNTNAYNNLLAIINRGVVNNNNNSTPSYGYQNQPQMTNMNNMAPQNNYLQNYYPFQQQTNPFIPNSTSLSSTENNNNQADTLDLSKALISQSEIYSNLSKFQ